MPPIRFTVTEARVAATCPRIFYFDRRRAREQGRSAPVSTRIWKRGAESTACGTVFHRTIERMNRAAGSDPELADLLARAPDRDHLYRGWMAYVGRFVPLDRIRARPVAQQQGFFGALHRYVGELADIGSDALRRGKPVAELVEHLFGDRRRRVDVTLQVGPDRLPVQVVGELDYVFHDWRTGGHRILDYKLTPPHQPSNDLFQVTLYALMHDRQHSTRSSVGVLYLHPERRVVELSWEQVESRLPDVLALLASMVEWTRFDESAGSGLRPPGEPSWCPSCRWDRADQCVNRLGPKPEGARVLATAPPPPQGGPAPPGTAAPEATEGGPVEAGTDRPSPSGGSRGLPSMPPDHPEPAVSDPVQAGSLWIGSTGSGERVELPLGALPTHVAVVGAAGGGKTWTAKVVVEEAILQGVPVLAIDPQGDLVQFVRAAPPSADPALARRHAAFLARVEPRVWTPGGDHGRPIHFPPLKFPAPDDWRGLEEPDQDEYLGLAATQLVELAGVARGRVDVHQAFLMVVLRRLLPAQLLGPLDLPALVDAIADPDRLGPSFDPDGFLGRGERTRLAQQLNSLVHGPARRLFEGGEPFDLDRLGRAEAPGKTPLNVVYLNGLPSDALKARVVALIMAEVYRWMVGAGSMSGGGPSMLLYLDEARDFAPAGSSTPPAKEPLVRLFAQGRKFGVCGLICTQSPRSVDYRIFSNCSTKLIGRLESAQDVERVAEWFSPTGGRPDWLKSRVGAEPGSFVARWPGMPATLEGAPFRSRPLLSRHEGAWSPDRLRAELADPGADPDPRPIR